MVNKEKIRKIVGQNIRKARQKAKLSQERLADMVEVRQHEISRYENGIHGPQLDTLAALAEALNVPIAYFFDDAPDPPQK